jgi:hypothetical protein
MHPVGGFLIGDKRAQAAQPSRPVRCRGNNKLLARVVGLRTTLRDRVGWERVEKLVGDIESESEEGRGEGGGREVGARFIKGDMSHSPTRSCRRRDIVGDSG